IPACEHHVLLYGADELVFSKPRMWEGIERDPPGGSMAWWAKQPPMQQPQTRRIFKERVCATITEQPIRLRRRCREPGSRGAASSILRREFECLHPVADGVHHVLANTEQHGRLIEKEDV